MGCSRLLLPTRMAVSYSVRSKSREDITDPLGIDLEYVEVLGIPESLIERLDLCECLACGEAEEVHLEGANRWGLSIP